MKDSLDLPPGAVGPPRLLGTVGRVPLRGGADPATPAPGQTPVPVSDVAASGNRPGRAADEAVPSTAVRATPMADGQSEAVTHGPTQAAAQASLLPPTPHSRSADEATARVGPAVGQDGGEPGGPGAATSLAAEGGGRIPPIAPTGEAAAPCGARLATPAEPPEPTHAAATERAEAARSPDDPPAGTGRSDDTRSDRGPAPARTREAAPTQPFGVTLDTDADAPIRRRDRDEAAAPRPDAGGRGPGKRGGGSGGGGGGDGPPGGASGRAFHKRAIAEDNAASLKRGLAAVRHNMAYVMVLTCATNLLILAIPIYLFQISDRVLTSRSVDTLIMLTVVIGGALILQAVFDAVRRFMLMRTAVEVAAQLGAPVLSAAAHASLHGTGREYQTLGDLQQMRSFLVSGTLIAFLDVPFVPLLILVIYFIHPHLGTIVVVVALALFVIALINQRLTEAPFAEANLAQGRANQHLDSMARNSQVINAMAMVPEAVRIWGRDTAASLTAQVRAQDRNIVSASISRGIRLLTQVAMLGWGAYLAIDGQITGGMVIAASIIAGRALAPIEGSIEGWNAFVLSRAAFGRVAGLLRSSKLQFERLRLPRPEGRLDVERLLYVPGGTKHVVLNGVSFALNPGETLAVIGNSGAGKTTLGKMLVGSILPTSGNVRLDLMDLRNWDPRQLGENIGYLPQDVQLFPGTIRDNIARMRADATDAQVYEAAALADVHEMIATLPQGYETLVAADGAPLSGGQKQRIALARAFFGNPRLVVLDEPNSNLDTAGDKALARAIQHARESRITTVVITQKPALLNVVDKILLLANGSVALFGAREQVLARLSGGAQAGPARPPLGPGAADRIEGGAPGDDRRT